MKFWKYQRRVSPTVVLFPLRWPPPRYKTFYAFRLPRVRQAPVVYELIVSHPTFRCRIKVFLFQIVSIFVFPLLWNFSSWKFHRRISYTFKGCSCLVSESNLLRVQSQRNDPFTSNLWSILSKNATGLTIRSLTSFIEPLENIIRDVFRDERR